MKLQTLVAAVDDTPAGLHAVRSAATIAEAARAKVFALRIVLDPWTGVRPEEVGTLQRRGMAPAAVAEARFAEELQQTIATTVGTARAEPVVRFGIPGHEIASWAARLGADLLVLGRQPIGPHASSSRRHVCPGGDGGRRRPPRGCSGTDVPKPYQAFARDAWPSSCRDGIQQGSLAVGVCRAAFRLRTLHGNPRRPTLGCDPACHRWRFTLAKRRWPPARSE